MYPVVGSRSWERQFRRIMVNLFKINEAAHQQVSKGPVPVVICYPRTCNHRVQGFRVKGTQPLSYWIVEPCGIVQILMFTTGLVTITLSITTISVSGHPCSFLVGFVIFFGKGFLYYPKRNYIGGSG